MKKRWDEIVLGPAKDPLNPRVFHTITLAALFAWVGLGADGLSSSCYGPEEAFKAIQQHHVLALPLAAFVALTVVVLSAGYSLLIEVFPSGGGGYLVSSKLLGRFPGVVCGWALVLDYILTIAVSTSGAVDAIFNFLPGMEGFKLYATLGLVVALILLNLRGVKESILILLPIFIVFIVTHLVLIGGAVFSKATEVPALFASAPSDLSHAALVEGGWLALFLLFVRAFTHGAGTFTGIEAVSNSMQILREPRVATGKRTMIYMAISLAITASGILIGYLLFNVSAQPGKTLNAVLFDRVFGGFQPGGVPVGPVFILIALISEGALLIVAAQAGFIGGPRTLAIMALDRWVPTRFSYLSNRLVVQDGVLVMGLAALAFVLFTGAQVKVLVILYSINVFITFTLSQIGMCRHWLRTRASGQPWKRKFATNGAGLVLAGAILLMMVGFKFTEGGWVTLSITAVGIVISYLVHRHYDQVRKSIRDLDLLVQVPPVPTRAAPLARSPTGPTAVLLVGGFNGLGMHSFLTILRLFPSHFKNYLFVSIGVVDYEEFKGVEEIENLRNRTVGALDKYVEWAQSLGLYAEERHAIGTDLVNEIEKLALKINRDLPGSIFFGGQLVFQNENFLTRSLHSQAAFEIQRRLQFSGLPMVLLPVRIRESARVSAPAEEPEPSPESPEAAKVAAAPSINVAPN